MDVLLIESSILKVAVFQYVDTGEHISTPFFCPAAP